jgi:hypothetical protein
VEHLPRFQNASLRKTFLAPQLKGDGFQMAVNARRAGHGAPGATGFGLTRDRAACALPATAHATTLNTPLLAATAASATSAGGEAAEVTDDVSAAPTGEDGGGAYGIEDGDGDAGVTAAAFGAMMSHVKRMAQQTSPEGPTEDDLARAFFQGCLAEPARSVDPVGSLAEPPPESNASSSPRSEARAGAKAGAAAAQAALVAAGVPASVLLAALDAQAVALATAARTTGDHESPPADRPGRLGAAAAASDKGASPLSQSAVLQKLQATPPLRDALLVFDGGSQHEVGSDGSNGRGVAELDWLVFCEAVEDLIKWNEFVL